MVWGDAHRWSGKAGGESSSEPKQLMATTSCRFHIIQMTKAGNGVLRHFAGRMAFMEIPKAGHMAIDPTLPGTILQRLNTAHSAWQQRLLAWATPGALPLDRVGNDPNFETYTFG